MKILLLLFLPTVLAADASKPHPHRGTIAPFVGAPAKTDLNADELAKFLADKPVLKQTSGEKGGQGVAIFRVNAPVETVWSVILDYQKYPKWIGDLDETEIYRRSDGLLFVRFKTAVMGVEVEWFIRHTLNTDKGYVTWTLDYDRESDLEDSVGYWRVTPSKKNPEVTRVEYSVNLQLRGWVPGFIKKILVDQGLEDATSWVKLQSESRHRP